MASIETFIKNLYKEDSSLMLYVYIALVVFAVLLIIIILITSVISSKKKKAAAAQIIPVELKPEVKEASLPEKQQEVQEIIPVIEQKEVKKAEPIVQEFSPVYIDKKDSIPELKTNIQTVPTEKKDSDLFDIIGKTKDIPIIPEKREITQEFIIPERQTRENIIPETTNEMMSANTGIFNMTPFAEPEPIQEAKVEPVVLSSDEIKNKLNRLQSRAHESVINELDALLAKVGMSDDERDIPNLADEENTILGR